MHRLGLITVGLLMLAGCSTPTTPEPGPLFDNEGQAEVRCMRHQTAPPGARYIDPQLQRTEEAMVLLRYYTANGDKPYCDGDGPGEADRAWAKLYVDLGADPAHVANLLG